jgi:ATP-binding cassette, subfamily B, multidrug efflux pump
VRALLRLFRYLRRSWRLTVGAYICLVLSSVFTLVVPGLLGKAVDEGISRGDLNVVAAMSVAILVASALRGVFAFGQGYLGEAAAQAVSYTLRNELFVHVQKLSFSFHDQAETGELMARGTADVEAVRGFTGRGLLQIVNVAVLVVGVAIALVQMNVVLALVSLAILPALVWRTERFSRAIRPMHTAVQQELAALATRVQESVAGIRVVKAFGRERYEIDRFDTRNAQLFERYVVAARTTALNAPFLDLLSNVSTLLMLWLSGLFVVTGLLTMGEMVAFYSYLLQLVQPIRRGGWLMAMASRASASSARIFEVLDTPVAVADKPGAVELPPLEGRVELEAVSCAYHPGRPVLEQVSFRVEPGQTVALVGSTGSGKTSVANLIPRFYDVSAGSVRVDGFDVRDVQLNSLRRQIGVVLQETLLFSGTVRSNIAFGRPDADEDDIRQAAVLARADEFIARLPRGMDTPVGERGVTLSGGQKQRIALARALLMDPRILILDEFTSSVDLETERLIRAAMEEVLRGRTTFVIAHRLATVRSADQILVLRRGRLVAHGTHAELVESSAEYREIYATQLAAEEPAGGEEQAVLTTTLL